MDQDAVQSFLDADLGSHCLEELCLAQVPAVAQDTARFLLECGLLEKGEEEVC